MPLMRRFPVKLCLFALIAGLAWANQVEGQYYLDTHGTEDGQKWATRRFSTHAEVRRAVESIYTNLVAGGFLYARIDTAMSDSTMHCRIHRGPLQLLERISIRSDSFAAVVADPHFSRRKPTFFDVELIDKQARLALTYLENHGYPFAGLEIEKMSVRDSLWSFDLSVVPGPRITLDSLVIKSSGKIPRNYIKNYLGWKEGALYDESFLVQSRSRLAELSFLQVKQPSEVVFHGNKADLFIYLEKRKSNTFNGIVGLQPEEKGGVTLTGDLEIKLLNAFNSGEEVYLNWRRLQSETQELQAKTRLPFLFGTPFGTEAWIRIYRRDSTFSQLKAQIGLVFSLTSSGEIKLFAERNSSSRLSKTITAADLANSNSTLYGLAARFSRLDYRYNPRKGYSVQVDGATGKREIRRPSGDEVNEIVRNTGIYRFQGVADYFIPVLKKQCIRLGAQAATILVDDASENELFRIGGLKTIRGIDEEGIFARSYAIATFEYRLLLEQNSALYVYADQAWYEAVRMGQLVTDVPLGYGAGIFFETKAGIFTFNYGLARQFDNPVLLRNARLSFGFRNVF